MSNRRRSSPRVGRPEDFGNFDADVTTRWLPDGRRMTLLQAHTFRQTGIERPWVAPIGAISDGASIPEVFWSTIGGPFEGKYRDAAVNHDYECCARKRPWRTVHRMFYAGMRAKDVEPWLAALLYFAVYFFGPRWPNPDVGTRSRFAEGDILRVIALAKRRPGITPEDIEALTQKSLRAAVPPKPRSAPLQPNLSDTRPIRQVGPRPARLRPDTTRRH